MPRKSKHTGGWSEWAWSEDNNDYYSARENRNGSFDYRWARDERVERDEGVDPSIDDSGYMSGGQPSQDETTEYYDQQQQSYDDQSYNKAHYSYSNSHVVADQKEEDYDDKLGEDNNRRQRNQERFRDLNNATPRQNYPTSQLEEGFNSLSLRNEQLTHFQPGMVYEKVRATSGKKGKAASKPSIFIVVAYDPQKGYSDCVAVSTYGGEACSKRGVNPQDHGIVYPGTISPRPLRGEPVMGFDPVRVDVAKEQKLHIESRACRVDYSKAHKLKRDAEVNFIGRIVDEDLQIVLAAVNCYKTQN